MAITAETRISICVQRRAMSGKPVAKSVAMHRKRALTVETGSRREVRYRGPAAEMRGPSADVGAAEMRPSTDASAAEVGCATAG